jgi:hypothetical protein
MIHRRRINSLQRNPFQDEPGILFAFLMPDVLQTKPGAAT